MAIEEPIKTSGELMWVRADTLTVDPQYQRRIHPDKVRRIMNEFDPDAFGVLYISSRQNGEDVVLDGQQRLAAVIGMEWGDQLVPAIVYTNLTVAQEAALFTMYNTVRTKPRPSDLYRAALVAGDPAVTAIQSIIDKVGLRIGDTYDIVVDDTRIAMGKKGPSVGRIHSIAAVRRIYDNTNGSGKVLHRALTVASRAWDMNDYAQRDALSADMLIALAIVIARHDPDDDRLVKVLMGKDPSAMVNQARALRAERGKFGSSTNVPQAGLLAGLIVGLYNKRLSPTAKIKFDVEMVGVAFWRSASLPPSDRQKAKARRAEATTAGALFTDEQMERFYLMRMEDGVRWAEVHAAMRKASTEFDEANHDTDTARNAVVRWAETNDKPLTTRPYVRRTAR